ncbi:MAG: FtsX-like permease family protein [Nitrospirales bacterium]|nr:FtsX-like permease family protein [Nitrospirales bacterium]
MSLLPNRMALRLAWRETRADWRRFTYFFVCIALGVAALVGVGLFAANMDRAIQREARGLLAADVELRTARPLTPEGETILARFDGRGIARMHVSELVAMAAASAGTQLIELKAVEPGYPFYGKLRADPEEAPAALFGGSQVLAEETLLIRLGLQVGGMLKIGQADFRIAGVLKKEPDRAAGAFSFGPRVLMSRQSLDATQLVQPGSRVTHRHLFKLPEALSPRAVQGELASTFPDKTVRVSTYQESQPILRRFLRQLTMYLGLVGLIVLMVGGIGVAGSVRAFLKEKMEAIAVLKAIGAESRTILQVYFTQTLLLGLVGSLAGAALGAALQIALPPLMQTWLTIELEFQFAWLPFVRGVAMGLLTTALFSLWPLLEVRHVRPNLIFRREVSEEPTGFPGRAAWIAGTLLALALAGLALWQAGSWRTAGLFIGALVAALGLLQGTAWLVVRFAKRLPRWRPLVWRQGLANLHRPGSQAKTILVSVGVGVMVILAIHLVERNILWEIGENIPADAPSFFFIDIQPDQKEAFARLMAEHGHADMRLTPLVRSRLWALNGKPVRRENHEEREHGWYYTREYVLTFQQELPKENVVTKGRWWDGTGPPGQVRVSVEEEAAHRLGLDLGSAVEFDIQGARVFATVASIRKVEWGNMSTNFYFIFEPGALEGAPMTYVATARVNPTEEIPLQRAVVAAFPNVSAINIRDVLDSVARVVDRISLVIRFMAGLSMLAGSVVLAGALAATRFRRIYEAMILKAVGATRGVIAGTFAVEYALLGAAAGVIGTGLAVALAWGVGRWILDVKWLFQPAALAWGIAATMAGTILVGFLSTYRILGQKPLPVLRRE